MVAETLGATVVQPAAAGFAMTDESIPAADAAALELIRSWIFTHTGLHFGERKRFVLYRRLQTLCWRLGIPSLDDMNRRLKTEPSSQLALDIACAVSTNHTFFFREPEVLEYLKQVILPQLPADEVWRIWSAASSSGEEAYTVGILISEALGLRSIQDKVAILGTDISQPMIEQAEHGVYDQYRLEQVPPPFLKRYFEPVGLGQWRVVPWLRQMCTFRRMNLQSPQWPFRYPFHVILCRNVLYYFDGPHQEQLLTSLYEAAAPGAWLLTSVTETLHSLNTPWEKIGPGVFRKKR